MSNENLIRSDVFAAMNDGGQPFKVYAKTILGKVLVRYWDNFTGTPAEALLTGDPRKHDEGCLVQVWDEKGDAYFKRMNKRHFEDGTLISYTVKPVVEAEKPIEQYSDEELKEIVNSKFMALTNKLNKITSIAVLFRMRALAEEENKSAKITGAIESRISEIQSGEYSQKPETEE